jgi:hypothetical protein
MSNFRKLYPPSGKNLFDGGLNSKFEKSIIQDNESPDCLNVVFENGSVGTRNGFKKVNTASVGSFACDGLYTRQGTNNAETMIGFYGGHGFAFAGTSFVTIPSAQSLFTAGQRMGGALMENHLFVGNGGTIPYKWNGTDFTRHGVYEPSTMSASFSTGAAGNPNGAYQYKVVYRNSALVAGNPSTASATFTVANTKISIACLPIAPQSWGVDSRRLYRTVTSGATFFLVGTINDNTTTAYIDDTADSSLGAVAPSDKGVLPKYSTIIYHANRLFFNDTDNPGFVGYTDLNEPYTVASTNFQIVGNQSSDLVKGFGIEDNHLVVFCEKNVYVIYMPSTDPNDWRVIKAKSSYTSKSPHGIFSYNNKVGFPAMQNDKFVGIAALVGDSVEPSAELLTSATMGSELKSDRIEPDMFDIQEAYVGNISSIVYKNKAYISMTKASGNTTNNRTYVMDFSIDNLSKQQKEAWAPWSGINVAQFTIYAGSLYYGSSTANGFLYKEDVGVYADSGSAINSYFWTKEFVGYKGEESYSKDFRYTNILVDLAGAYFMNIGVKTDSDSGSGTEYAVSVDPESSLWGTMVLGVDTWGGGSYQKDIKFSLGGARGKRIQFKFSNQNTINQRFKVHWQNFTYNLKGPR